MAKAARASLASVQLLACRSWSFGARAVFMTDSQVTLGALAKGRSRVPVLNRICRQVAGVVLGYRWKLHWRYVRTWRNHADAPSRGKPFGAMPLKDPREERLPYGAELPDFFYKLTKG